MTAMICRTIAQANGIKAKLEDFMPREAEKPEELPDDPKARAAALKERFLAILPPKD